MVDPVNDRAERRHTVDRTDVRVILEKRILVTGIGE